MELPLTPLEFARRTRKLYPEREGVVDGELRLTYEQFFTRCDRWSAVLQALGVRQGDRVAYIAPNTHAQLESFRVFVLDLIALWKFRQRHLFKTGAVSKINAHRAIATIQIVIVDPLRVARPDQRRLITVCVDRS